MLALATTVRARDDYDTRARRARGARAVSVLSRHLAVALPVELDERAVVVLMRSFG